MQIKNRQQMLIIVAVAVAALFIGDRVVLTPLARTWSARSDRIADLQKRITQGRALLQRQTGIRAHWEQMSSRTLTNNPSAAEQQVFDTVDLWARDTGVTITAITPQWKRDTEDYAAYECRIDATGDLSRLTQFLHRAEREPIALRIESIELAARDKEGQLLSLGLQFNGLVLNSKGK